MMRRRYALWAGLLALVGLAVMLAILRKPPAAGPGDPPRPPRPPSFSGVKPAQTAPVDPAGAGAGTNGITAIPTDSVSTHDPNKAPLNPLRPKLATGLLRLAAESDPARQREALEALIAQIATADLGRALAVLTDPEFEKTGAELRRRLFERWGGESPATAAAWAGRMSAGDARADAYGDVAQGWASRDASAAKAWALGLSEASDRDAALAQVGYVLGRTQPVEALQLAIAMEATPRRDELVHFSAAQWASQSPGDAVAWASQVTDEGLREGLLRNIFTEWGDADPTAAATAAVKSMPEGRAQNDTVVGIVQRWVQKEPEIAAAWVASFPDGELRETAGRELVTLWADQAAEDAGRWLNELPTGGFRDTAVAAYVGKILPMAPETAAVWAAEISDPARRGEELERVGAAWLESDATAARAWIPQSALSAEAKARLLAPRKPEVLIPESDASQGASTVSGGRAVP